MPISKALRNEKPISVITISPSFYSEPVWPSGKALGLLVNGKDLGSIPASALRSHQKGCGFWTLSCDFVHHFLLKY